MHSDTFGDAVNSFTPRMGAWNFHPREALDGTTEPHRNRTVANP